MTHTTVIHDQLLLLLKSAHLQRLARFALIDEVPSPWGLRGKRTDGSATVTDLSEEA